MLQPHCLKSSTLTARIRGRFSDRGHQVVVSGAHEDQALADCQATVLLAVIGRRAFGQSVAIFPEQPPVRHPAQSPSCWKWRDRESVDDDGRGLEAVFQGLRLKGPYGAEFCDVCGVDLVERTVSHAEWVPP